MKSITLWTTIVIVSCVFVFAGKNTFAADDAKKKDTEVAKPANRVAVMYFHRTKRCPTCKKIGSYVEQVVKGDFEEQLKTKKVGLYFVDFQQKKNAKIAKAFKITGPTLVVAQVVDNKAAAWKPMPRIWKLVGNQEEFFQYVHDGVVGYLKNLDEKKEKSNL